MITADHTIEILVPVAEDVPEEIGLTDSLSRLEGKVVGLLENRKYHADTFMQELEQTLLNDYGVKKVVYSRKSTYSAPHPDDKLEALLQRVRRHHPRHRRLRLLHGVGSPRHGIHRIQGQALGQRNHQQLHPRGQSPRRLPGNARRPHRRAAQPAGVAASGGRAADGPRVRAGNCGAAGGGQRHGRQRPQATG